jgi:CHAD domain-containing protein
VMLATLADLGRRYPDHLPTDAAGELRRALEAHRIQTSGGALGPASRAAIATLEAARPRVDDWPLSRDGFDAFEDGLERIYRRGRRDFRAAPREPSAERLHEWRKRVKDLWYHTSLLRDTWEPVMTALAGEAHELSDRLGDDHDLAVLLDWARQHTGVAAPALEDVVARRRAELQAEAFGYGARLYADRPGAYVGRVRRWWNASAGAARAAAAQH